MNEDESHLRGLAIAHYVVGGCMVLFACFPLDIYVFAMKDFEKLSPDEKALILTDADELFKNYPAGTRSITEFL